MVDFEKGHAIRMAELERTSALATNSVTLRDYFAARAMEIVFNRMKHNFTHDMDDDWTWGDEDYSIIADFAYRLADAMLASRIKLTPKPKDMTVEEAFGL